MKNIKRMLPTLLLLATLCAAASCKPNPKKKCNTCPKWTSELQHFTSSETQLA